MDLFYRKKGSGAPLIICHGLYGMSENWLPIAEFLSDKFEVFIPDMRNHGLSPHSQEHSYSEMSKDILQLCEKNNLKKVSFIGHSMGGKACMQLAADNDKIFDKLAVIDISPKEYSEKNTVSNQSIDHYSVLKFMISVDFSKLRTRQEISEIILSRFKDTLTQQFLIKNITKGETSVYRWKLNAQTIFNKYFEVLKGVDFGGKKIEVPSLFLKGENSKYILADDETFICEHFTNYEIKTVKNSGHMIHVENPSGLVCELREFLLK